MEASIDEAVKAYLRRAEEEVMSLSSSSSSATSSAASASFSPRMVVNAGPTLGARLATRMSLVGAELLLAGSPPKVREGGKAWLPLKAAVGIKGHGMAWHGGWTDGCVDGWMAGRSIRQAPRPSKHVNFPQAVDAALLLINAARKESAPCGSASSAWLMEQAAWAYLRGGNIRKFAFYVAMAGQMYLGCGQDKVRACVLCCVGHAAEQTQQRCAGRETRHLISPTPTFRTHSTPSAATPPPSPCTSAGAAGTPSHNNNKAFRPRRACPWGGTGPWSTCT